jgi:acyl carrier protein
MELSPGFCYKFRQWDTKQYQSVTQQENDIMSTMEQLNAIFCQVFDDDDIKVAPETTANDVDGWDSLSHVNLIVAVEAHFGIRFSQKELLTFKNVGDLLKAIESKISK